LIRLSPVESFDSQNDRTSKSTHETVWIRLSEENLSETNLRIGRPQRNARLVRMITLGRPTYPLGLVGITGRTPGEARITKGAAQLSHFTRTLSLMPYDVAPV